MSEGTDSLGTGGIVDESHPVDGAPIGVIGTGVMGAAIARNLARQLRAPVSVFDSEPGRVATLVAADPRLSGFEDLAEFVRSLSAPRTVLLMVPAGAAVDVVLGALVPLLDQGDIVIDGGNSHYSDTERRVAECAAQDVTLVGMGVSGGEQGALLGPALMAGGEPSSWTVISQLLKPIAAKAWDGDECAALVGSGGAGHFTKMVHNGIEYADLQLIAEAYSLLRATGLSPAGVADCFQQWSTGRNRSYLLDCATEVLRQDDPGGSGPLIDVVLDEALGKGTGAWTVIAAAETGVSVSVIAEALFARATSAARLERDAWLPAELYEGTEPGRPALIPEQVREGYLAARLIAYQQGFSLLRAASQQHHWDIDLATVARIWRAGCIIRSGFLDDIASIFTANPATPSFLSQEPFRGELGSWLPSLKTVVSQGATTGIPLPATAAALNHQLLLGTGVLPTALVQLQRDFFGAHTYRRVDREGSFHLSWDGTREELPR